MADIVLPQHCVQMPAGHCRLLFAICSHSDKLDVEETVVATEELQIDECSDVHLLRDKIIDVGLSLPANIVIWGIALSESSKIFEKVSHGVIHEMNDALKSCISLSGFHLVFPVGVGHRYINFRGGKSESTGSVSLRRKLPLSVDNLIIRSFSTTLPTIYAMLIKDDSLLWDDVSEYTISIGRQQQQFRRYITQQQAIDKLSTAMSLGHVTSDPLVNWAFDSTAAMHIPPILLKLRNNDSMEAVVPIQGSINMHVAVCNDDAISSMAMKQAVARSLYLLFSRLSGQSQTTTTVTHKWETSTDEIPRLSVYTQPASEAPSNPSAAFQAAVKAVELLDATQLSASHVQPADNAEPATSAPQHTQNSMNMYTVAVIAAICAAIVGVLLAFIGR